MLFRSVPLSGYLLLGAELTKQGDQFASAWNFGPPEILPLTTQTVVEHAIRCWGSGKWVHKPLINAKKETEVLKLNWEKAANQLDWLPAYPWEKAIAQTVDWFKAYQTHLDDGRGDLYRVCVEQIRDYMIAAKKKGMAWCE